MYGILIKIVSLTEEVPLLIFSIFKKIMIRLIKKNNYFCLLIL